MTTKTRTNPVSEERAAELRATVPDDPKRLPKGHLACEACGIAVPDPNPPKGRPVEGLERARLGWPTPHPRFARCPKCAEIHRQATAYAEAHPRLVHRRGSIVTTQIEDVLLALDLLGQAPASLDLGLALPRFVAAFAGTIRFRKPMSIEGTTCSGHRWGHVKTGTRARLRRACADALADSLARRDPPVIFRCPSAGCLVCGLNAVKRSALEVRRRGHSEAAAAVWTPYDQPAGPHLLRGHLCPECAESVEDAGAVGTVAAGRALRRYASTLSDATAERVAHLLDEGAQVPLWARLPEGRRRPSATRFDYVDMRDAPQTRRGTNSP